MPKKSQKTKEKPLFTRNETIGLAKRFVKEDKYNPANDLMVLYRLFKKFPNRQFWLNYDLGFQLNSTFWFLSKEGNEKLKTDYSIFTLHIDSRKPVEISDSKFGEDYKIKPKPKSIMDLLKNNP